MELNEEGFLEELLALRREAWDSTPSSSTVDHQINGFFSTSNWPFDGLDSTTPSYESFSSTIDQQPPPPPTATTSTTLDCSSFFLHALPFNPTFPDPSPGPDPDYTMSSMMEGANNSNNIDNSSIVPCKAEHSSMSSGEVEFEIPPPSPAAGAAAGFNIGLCMEKSRSTSGNAKSKVKKVEGQPSKNLMAERRRRKRLNDRLSMLRSVVPKISKMDRTSILGDTIDYMKELLERINNLQEEMDVGADQLNVLSIFKDVKPNDVLVRNSPKFDVERRNLDTRVEICCAGKPGLLLSTVTTLEALGLEIQQCVISCFNDFSLQASCFEEMEQKSLINSEEMKQALFRNAGYGGRCL